MFLVTFENGMTTIMTTKELIAAKAWLLAVNANWERIS